MTMPDMSGLQALELIQEIDASVPIVMITGNEDGVRTVEAPLKGGIVSYVPKPFNLRYLEHIVTAALGPRLARRHLGGHGHTWVGTTERPQHPGVRQVCR